MKIEGTENHEFLLKEVFNVLNMETEEGNRVKICMRDDTFEFAFYPKGEYVAVWYRFNMQTRQIEKL
jgi:hypothetical protein